MAIIVEFPSCDLVRSARKMDDGCDAFGEILLFTGVRYDRDEQSHVASRKPSLNGSHSMDSDVILADAPKSVG